MKTMTLAEWQEEAMRRGGGDLLNVAFRCPLCGNVSTAREFKEAGAERPDQAASNCIGRFTGAKGGLNVTTKPMPQPCDWAAFGLLGTLGKGIEITLPDGTVRQVFDFADEAVTP